MENVDKYLRGTFQTTEGWCIPQLWQTIQPLYQCVQAAGGDGPVAEIGVYHGKFFIGLVKTVGEMKPNYAIDVFDLQQHNLDGAGKGNLEKFKVNLGNAEVALDQVEFLKTDSMWLNHIDIQGIRVRSGGFSMFSVDGCHLAEHTLNDMEIASQLVKPQGLIFVDDYYNSDWPGVQEGVAKHFLMQNSRFVPLAYTCNKLILCNLSFHQTYLIALSSFVEANFPDTRIKKVKRFGYDTVNVHPNFRSGANVAL